MIRVRKLTREEAIQHIILTGDGIPSFYLENVVLPTLEGHNSTGPVK